MVKIQFYPLDIDYKIVADKVIVQLFGRTKQGKQICVQDLTYAPYFYILTEKSNSGQIINDLQKLNISKSDRKIFVTKTEIVEKKYKGNKVKLVKVYTKLPGDISSIRKEISQHKTFEADINFSRRYLIDKKITPLVLTDVQGELINQKSKVTVLNAESISQNSTEIIDKVKILAIDIETYNPLGKQIDPDRNPILMISFYTDGFQKVIVTKSFKTNLDYVEFVEDEKVLLTRIQEVIEEIKPDVLTGYFSDVFDLPYIAKRAKKNNVKLELGLNYSLIQVKKGRYTTSKIIGIPHIDIYKFVRRAFSTTLETPKYSLSDVAQELLGEDKTTIDLQNLANTYDDHPEKLGEFSEYNLKDSELTYKLAQNLLPNIIELVKIVNVSLYDATRMGFSQLVEWYLIRRAKDFNELIPNKPDHKQLQSRRQATYQGAFVYEPQPGLYSNIIIFDFRSLYPSIVTSHNISPDTLNCECCEGKNIVPGKDYWFCQNKKGFISTVIEQLITRRMRIKEIIKNKKESKILFARQYALKTIANAMYGYLGFSVARWYSIESAISITAYGRYYIQKLIDKAKSEGFKILYGDTDSVFLTLENKTRSNVNDFIEKINLELPEFMELELQGFYPRGIFVSAKLGTYGAKKKYALLSEDRKIIVKGFETVRRNISAVAKETQEQVLNMILKENNTQKAIEYVRGVIDKIKKREITLEQVTIYTKLQKPISEYENIGPHVAIAKRLQSKGYEVGPGMIVEYVVCSQGEKIRDKARLPSECTVDDYDPEYYINNQIIPAVEKIFEVLGYTKQDFLANVDQKKLDGFFK